MNLRRVFLLLAWSALTPAQAADLEVGLLELVNYYEYAPNLLSSGQPTREQFPAIKSAGVEAIVNLAPVTDPASIPEERQIVSDLKIDYTHIPVDWENPTQSDYDRFLAAMKQYAGKRVLVHCYAGSRASAFTYLYRVNELKVPSQSAREIMIELWANSPGYEFHKMPQWRNFVARAEH